MKAMYKSELARLAGVSYSSFYRFLREHRDTLTAMGYRTNSQTLRGRVLHYVCELYDIDLPEESPEPLKKHIKFR